MQDFYFFTFEGYFHRIQDSRLLVLFAQHLNISLYSSVACKVFENLGVILNFVPLYVKCFYLFWPFFKIFNLSLILYSLNTIYLHVFLFFWFLVWVLLGFFFFSHLSCLLFSELPESVFGVWHKFWGKLRHCFIYFLCSCLSSLSSISITHVLHFLVVLQSLAIPFYVFSCSFCFSVLKISIAVYHFFVVPSSDFHLSAYIVWLFLYVVYFIH